MSLSHTSHLFFRIDFAIELRYGGAKMPRRVYSLSELLGDNERFSWEDIKRNGEDSDEWAYERVMKFVNENKDMAELLSSRKIVQPEGHYPEYGPITSEEIENAKKLSLERFGLVYTNFVIFITVDDPTPMLFLSTEPISVVIDVLSELDQYVSILH